MLQINKIHQSDFLENKALRFQLSQRVERFPCTSAHSTGDIENILTLTFLK